MSNFHFHFHRGGLPRKTGEQALVSVPRWISGDPMKRGGLLRGSPVWSPPRPSDTLPRSLSTKGVELPSLNNFITALLPEGFLCKALGLWCEALHLNCNLTAAGLSSPVYVWRDWGSVRVKDLLKVIQPAVGWAWLKQQVTLHQSLSRWPPHSVALSVASPPSSRPGRQWPWVADDLWYKEQRSLGTSLVVLWLRISLPVQGTWVQSLIQEDPTCLRATKLSSYNC